MKALYIPGLATNHRLFSPLIERLGGCCLSWTEPDKSDDLKGYSRRITAQLDKENLSDVCLIGFCFGGVMAMEMAQNLSVAGVVTINAPGDSGDISDDFRKGVLTGGKIPRFILKSLLAAKGPGFFGTRDSLDENQLSIVRNMLSEIDFNFLTWAAKASINWDQTFPPEISCPHLGLHGELDQITRPPKQLKVEILNGVGHLIPLTHPDQLSSRIQQFWKNIQKN